MAKKEDNIIKNALILFTITLIAGLLLGMTNELTKGPIEVQEKLKVENALKSVADQATSFEEVPVEEDADLPGVNAIYKAMDGDETVGYCFQMTATEGYGGDIQLIVGVGIDSKILGIDIVSHSETPGLGAKADGKEFKSEFAGEEMVDLTVVKVTPSETPGEISSISGATITSRSVTNAVNVSIDYYDAYLMEVK